MRQIIASALFVFLVPLCAHAQEARDRVAFGSDVHIAPGELVRDVVSFGGNAVVEGEVLGDAVSFGGSVVLREGGRVHGDIVSFGGDVKGRDVPAASSGRDAIDKIGEWISDTARSAVSHVLLFLLGLFLIGVTRDRLGAMQVTMIKDGLKTAGAGLLAYVTAVIAIVLLAITIIGIPLAVVLALALPVATYVGLAAAATVLGAALPIPQWKEKEILQLAAGIAVLFAASLVPVVGTIATAVAACLGVGALVRTRFSPNPPRDLPPHEGGSVQSPASA